MPTVLVTARPSAGPGLGGLTFSGSAAGTGGACFSGSGTLGGGACRSGSGAFRVGAGALPGLSGPPPVPPWLARVELGLGIDRQLRKRGLRRLPRAEVSFWYLANRLGRRFREEAAQVLGALEPAQAGLWRSPALGRMVCLVSTVDLPVEEDALPLHLVGREPADKERAVARLVQERPELQARYGGWAATLHPAAWTEAEAMARAAGKKLLFDVRPAIEMLGLERVLEQVGIDRVVEAVGIDRVVEAVGIDRVIAGLGPDRVLEKLGPRDVLRRIGIDQILANLSPAERRQLKRRLEA